MINIIKWLQGKKTYFVGLFAVLTYIFNYFGWIDSVLANSIYTALGIAGVFTIRAAIKK